MSGKQSKKVRREKRVSKKAVAGAAAALLCTAPLVSEGGEFLLSVFPHISIPVVKFDDTLQTGFGAGVMLTYRPIEYINLFAEGDYKQYRFNTKQDIGDISVIGGKVGAGYHLPISDRMGLDINAGVGYYSSSYEQGQGSQRKSTSVNGLSVTGSLLFSYKLSPVVSVFAGGGMEHLAYKDAKFITSADINPGLSINLTKAFSNKANISFDNSNLKPVFPVFYSWYNENSFGTVEISNHEDASITDVTVSFYHPQYMGQPQACGTSKLLKKGESMSVDLRAFFNEQMLNLNEKNDSMTSIIVEYKYLGAKRTATFPMVLPVYGRNNMSWEDDRCASAFVSSKDPAAMWFSKYVVSTIRDNVRSGLPTNIQYAMGIFEALDQFGINYVKDPTSAFEDNVGTASIDFLQFPYQTLMYRGGDCDDLSILVCSLFESIGIKTAFITIPGHIFMAFDSGFTVEEAQDYFISLDEFIVDGDTVWVPLEITLSDEGFNKAWHKGAWEWNTADRTGDAMLYRMEDSWQTYKPVNVPGATARFTLPEEQYVAKLFSHSVDEFVFDQITPKIAYYENRIAAAPTAANYNDLGVLYARYGLFELAEQNFRVARSMKYLPSVLNTANLYYSIKDFDRAANWYNEVLSSDQTILLAKLGLARCAYEKGDYADCDKYFAEVYNTDRSLAKKYGYLGAFEETSGRSFSLADRLENTIWVSSLESSAPGTAAQVTETQLAAGNTDVVVKTPAPEPAAVSLEEQTPVVAVVPVTPEEEIKEEEREEEIEGSSLEGGDGDDDEISPNTVVEAESTVVEPVETTAENTESAELEDEEDTPYVGIASELEFNFLTIDDLIALAEEEIAASDTPVIAEATEPVIPESDASNNDELDTPVIPVLDTATFAEQTRAGISTGNEIVEGTDTESPAEENVDEFATFEASAEIAEADLRVKPEDDNKVKPEDDIDTSVIADADTTVIAEATEPVIPESDASNNVELDTSVIPVPDTATFAEQTRSGISTGNEIAEGTDTEAPAEENVDEFAAFEASAEIAEADLRVKPEDDNSLAEVDIKEEPVETTADLEPVVDSLAMAETSQIDTPSKDTEDENLDTIEELAAAPETTTTSLLTDVPLRAVPRFTTQPSEEWAPKEAYEVETIPGMKSFEEEMGNYQNEKAFLYKDEYDFAVNPGEELKDKEDDELTKNAVLEVNPFTSYLSEKEAQKMETITNFKLEDVVETVTDAVSTVADAVTSVLEPVPAEKSLAQQITGSETNPAGTTADIPAATPAAESKPLAAESLETTQDLENRVNVISSTSKTPIPEPEIIPDASIATSEETAVADQSENNNSNKSKLPYAAGAAGIAAAVAAVLTAKRRKEK